MMCNYPPVDRQLTGHQIGHRHADNLRSNSSESVDLGRLKKHWVNDNKFSGYYLWWGVVEILCKQVVKDNDNWEYNNGERHMAKFELTCSRRRHCTNDLVELSMLSCKVLGRKIIQESSVWVFLSYHEGVMTSANMMTYFSLQQTQCIHLLAIKNNLARSSSTCIQALTHEEESFFRH